MGAMRQPPSAPTPRSRSSRPATAKRRPRPPGRPTAGDGDRREHVLDAALACYLQAICRYLIQERPFEPAEDDYLVYTYNRFQACRFGLDGEVVNPQTKQRSRLRDDIVRTLAKVDAHAVDLKSWDACQQIRDSLGEGNDATWLRRLHRTGMPLSEVVETAARRWSGAV